ncbi:unnamed protein product [Cercopithifilaria johnstoni]|uniref:Uncharacterized protein n=1 Tax=Cercopithifilaria johnstoni TaxID=2874296 RepID=A0A8J2MDR2_9BILA|nr:unnamed protein product [Cercopithifilaria johnstoni]
MIGQMDGYSRRYMNETGRVSPDTTTGRQRWDRRTSEVIKLSSTVIKNIAGMKKEATLLNARPMCDNTTHAYIDI